jgi:hypothetical protein
VAVPLEPLLALPGDTQLALVTRLDARDLGVAEGPAAAALERLLGGKDDVTTLALLPGPGVVLRRHVQTDLTVGQGLAELMRPLEDALAKGALGPSFGKPRTSKVMLPALGAQAERLQTTLQAGAPAAKPATPGEPVDLLAVIRSEALFVAVTSKDARPLLLSVAQPPAGSELGKNAEVSALLSRHAGASTALVANVGAVLRAPRPATALFTWGRREQHVHGSLALTPGALGVLGGWVAR